MISPPIHPDVSDDSVQEAPGHECQHHAMTFDKTWSARVNMRTDDGEALAENLGHCPCCSTFCVTGRVDAQLCHSQDDGRLYASSHKAGAENLDWDGGDGDEDDVANTGDSEARSNKQTLGIDLVGDKADGHQGNGGAGLRDYGEELRADFMWVSCFSVMQYCDEVDVGTLVHTWGVAEGVDDCWKEEANRRCGQSDSTEHESEEI